MSVSVADPFLLSSYTTSKSAVLAEPSAPGPSRSTNVYATQQHASTSSAGSNYVTIAARGDGVHILDVSTLHPVVSHTLGPAVSFSCPAVTVTTVKDDTRMCTTYAVIESAQDVPAEGRGRTVWMWRENPTGDVGSVMDRRKHSVVLSHRVAEILVPADPPEHVLLIGQRGELSVTDSELSVIQTFSPAELPQTARFLKTFVFSRKTATFTPSRTAPKQGVIVSSFFHEGSSGQLRILAVDETAAVTELGSVAIPSQKSDIIDVSFSETGWLSVLCRAGVWSIYQLDTPDYTTLTLSVRPSISLRNLSFILPSPPPTPSSPHPHTHELSLLSLGSSHVLLAGISSSSSELALLLWDLQYSVLLFSHLFTLPTSIPRTRKQGITLTLSGPSAHASHVLLTLASRASAPSHAGGVNGASTTTTNDDNALRKASVLVVPVTVPLTSTIALAVGRAQAALPWTVPPPKANADIGSAAEIKLVKNLESRLGLRDAQGAEDAFFAFVRGVEDDVAAKNKEYASQFPNPNSNSGSDEEKGGDVAARFGREFVKRILDTMLHVSEKTKERTEKGETAGAAYSSKIVAWLLEKRVVSDGMVEGGLLAVLRYRNDWTNILLALHTVPDIPESDLVSLLASAASTYRTRQDSESMQVDTLSKSEPDLPTLLTHALSTPTSAPALRLALRTHLRSPEDLTTVLSVLVGWLEAWSTSDSISLPEGTKKDAHGATVATDTEERKADVPPVTKILPFLQTILDSSLLTLLTHTPSHPLLLTALTHIIEPELSFLSSLSPLQSVLAPFAERAEGPQKKDELGANDDWRRRRKVQQEKVAGAVGVYQVEEIVL